VERKKASDDPCATAMDVGISISVISFVSFWYRMEHLAGACPGEDVEDMTKGELAVV
jgi:hypothetical protein